MPVNPVSPRWVVAILAWAGVVGLGFFLLGAYHHRPCPPGAAEPSWPAAATVAFDPSRPTLLMFLHPRCPCSRASVAELASALAGRGGRVAAHAVLFRPEGSTRDWSFGAGLGPAAAAIPGLHLVDDPGGETARRFGVETSGHVLLYDAGGRLRFDGGITPSRGHRGANPGLSSLVALLDGGPAGPGRGPVFGCPTTNPPNLAATEAAR